jgi:hypothetical protein
MKFHIFPLFLVCFILSSCTVAPFSNHYSARSIGKDKWSINTGAQSSCSEVVFSRIGYGVTDNVDLGIVVERQFFDMVYGGWGRYAFLNQKEGFSASVEGGGGGSSLSSYAYVGAALGYKLNWWEPYVIARYNYVHYDNEILLDLGPWGQHSIHNKGEFDYGSVTLGQTFWFTEKVGLNLNINFIDSGLEESFCGAGLVVTF